MEKPFLPRHRSPNLKATLRVAPMMVIAFLLAGCSTRLDSFTGSLSDTTSETSASGVSTATLSSLAQRYDSRPGDKRASLEYAAALRANGQHQQAAAVLQRASVANVGDRDIAAAYGKSLADIGRFDEARSVLSQAHSEDRPNWQVLSTLGSIADQQGDHARAREFYQRALQIRPDEPSVLNNLGLSYVLTRELDKAEEVLRRAVSRQNADPRIQANLALAQQLRAGGARPATAASRQPTPAISPAPPRAPGAVRVSADPAPASAEPAPAPVAAATVAPAAQPVATGQPLTAPPGQGAIRPKTGGLFGLTGRLRGEPPADEASHTN